jgi:hypothetical protein
VPQQVLNKPQQGQQRPAAPPQPFTVGVYETSTPDIDVTLAQTTAAQKLGTFKISPNGWLAGIYCLFEMTVTGNVTNSVSYSKDNPFSVIQKVTFRDVGNREIFGPLTGYEWFTVNKWGGYFGGADGSDPRNPSGAYVATTGTGGTAGTFSFVLWMPLEIVHRDALGEIENKSASSSYTLEIYIDSQANTYNQVPSVQGSLRMRANLDGYTEPEAADSYGRPLSQNPPSNGSVQYWTSEVFLTPNGLSKYNIQNGIGYTIRNIGIIAYDNGNGTRATAGLVGGEMPDPTTITFGKVQLIQLPLRMWVDKMARTWELGVNAGPDAYAAPENGVLILPFTRDFINTPGDELRNRLLVTKAGNVLQWSGTTTAALSVHFLMNYIVPPGNDPARLRATR